MTNRTDAKTDFKTTLDAYQAKRGQFRKVDVPDMQYLMADSEGDPNTSSAFTEAVEALFPVAYKLKFASKRGRRARLRRAALGRPVVGRGHGRINRRA
jgi:hypothetical protein